MACFLVGCSGRVRGWGLCGSGCVVRLFLDNSTACFSVSVFCVGLLWAGMVFL
ncbi:hypothetical protein HMPREF0682_0631 [Propionibacterium acidifaciens F0233]|uniref:Uncharacterized protein n=1 Tax=Propionibacterium acidifaciens F0233 TaxID=553198 RepID=U2S055_9ACTN|nr:hypothetical protein HMPREF0682_1069 [Propionibacterium acidifaciens F0233]ERK55357.1 hypothetical protein HMPREF0682_2023 [Propionibacterium acidifaciens F0233]ERK56222.1 hypothetical protein HMPREF0682_0631 [Propionibacterium acidifaciens F0233]